MTISPLTHVESLRVGCVDSVSPDTIKVLLDIEAPNAIALNTGVPLLFPRINSYVLIASLEGYLVGQVEWIAIERSQYPKRKGMQDFGLVDLPYPLRKMSLNPMGILHPEGADNYSFKRGVESYPTVGDIVLLPTQKQLRAIVESGANRRVKIGASPLAANAEVKIDPDRLFGRHLAVLGNTGSGKSCTVAGLIRWSLAAAKSESEGKIPNARFIVLDPNGEYANTFKDMNTARVFAVEPKENVKELKVPLWLWNNAEWSAFTQASDRAQRPLLRRALREMRSGITIKEDRTFDLRRKISSMLITLKDQIAQGNNYEGWKFGPKLSAFREDVDKYSRDFSDHAEKLNKLTKLIDGILARPNQTYTKGNGSTGYTDFPATCVDDLASSFQEFLDDIGGIVFHTGPDEDVPLPFDGAKFADHLEQLARHENNPQLFDYLIMRIRTLLSDTRINQITSSTDNMTLDSWLNDYIGGNDAEKNGTITIIDLSLVPAEIVHIVTAVIARMTLESLQRYRKSNNGITLPTVLVMEEAHTFIKKYQENSEHHSAATICCQIFEKIAREGRKFGLGLVLSSQRPSELSPTVLSQCNSFLLHRIGNDRDQELVSKLLPDNLRGLLHDLPLLPSRHAILLGWASELPVLVQMNELAESCRPKSDDPDFWAAWSGTGKDENGHNTQIERVVDWQKIAKDWQKA